MQESIPGECSTTTIQESSPGGSYLAVFGQFGLPYRADFYKHVTKNPPKFIHNLFNKLFSYVQRTLGCVWECKQTLWEPLSHRVIQAWLCNKSIFGKCLLKVTSIFSIFFKRIDSNIYIYIYIYPKFKVCTPIGAE